MHGKMKLLLIVNIRSVQRQAEGLFIPDAHITEEINGNE